MTDSETLKRQIAEQRHEQAEQIRAWCREQAALWRQIPYECIACEGISGYLDRHAYAYNWGFWQLYSSSSGGYYGAYVDCSNGEIVNASSAGDFLKGKIGAPVRAGDEAVLGLRLDELDAVKTLADLREHAGDTPFYGYDQEKVEIWRNEKRAKLPDLSKPNAVCDSYDHARALVEQTI